MKFYAIELLSSSFGTLGFRHYLFKTIEQVLDFLKENEKHIPQEVNEIVVEIHKMQIPKYRDGIFFNTSRYYESPRATWTRGKGWELS